MWLYIIDVIWCNQAGLDTWITPKKPDSEPNSSHENDFPKIRWIPLSSTIAKLESTLCHYVEFGLGLPSGELTWQWKITIFIGKIHYKWPFSIAMLVHRRVRGQQKNFDASASHRCLLSAEGNPLAHGQRPWSQPESKTYDLKFLKPPREKRSNLFQLGKHGKTGNLMKHGISFFFGNERWFRWCYMIAWIRAAESNKMAPLSRMFILCFFVKRAHWSMINIEHHWAT